MVIPISTRIYLKDSILSIDMRQLDFRQMAHQHDDFHWFFDDILIENESYRQSNFDLIDFF